VAKLTEKIRQKTMLAVAQNKCTSVRHWTVNKAYNIIQNCKNKGVSASGQ